MIERSLIINSVLRTQLELLGQCGNEDRIRGQFVACGRGWARSRDRQAARELKTETIRIINEDPCSSRV